MPPKDPDSPGPRPGGVLPPTDVHTSSFATAAKAFDDEHHLFGTELAAVLADMAAIGDFAGDDERGVKFKNDYVKHAAQAGTYVEELRARYPEISARLRMTPATLDAADWATIQALPKVQAPPTYQP
ncbi:hypothetical protein ACFXJ8_16465 [Nonomuraea sp. NPDC059194]|uniref:hypothetical protein n=1 Tax=Nonomuraea sp. NPDC059194 TaxID=3346764 RepID=UPI0036C82BE1